MLGFHLFTFMEALSSALLVLEPVLVLLPKTGNNRCLFSIEQRACVRALSLLSSPLAVREGRKETVELVPNGSDVTAGHRRFCFPREEKKGLSRLRVTKEGKQTRVTRNTQARVRSSLGFLSLYVKNRRRSRGRATGSPLGKLVLVDLISRVSCLQTNIE